MVCYGIMARCNSSTSLKADIRRAIETDINQYYQDVAGAVAEGRPFKYFNTHYYILSGMKPTYHENHLLWVDYLLDHYNRYKSCDFNEVECEISSLMDGLEALMNASFKKSNQDNFNNTFFNDSTDDY